MRLTIRTAKQIGLPLLALLSFCLIYESIYGYKYFCIEDVRQPASFTYTKNGTNYGYVRLVVHVKGEINGRAIVSVDHCNNLKSTSYWYTPLIKLVVTGKVDTIMSGQYYSGQACIKYRPRKVENGKLSVAVSIRKI